MLVVAYTDNGVKYTAEINEPVESHNYFKNVSMKFEMLSKSWIYTSVMKIKFKDGRCVTISGHDMYIFENGKECYSERD